MAFLVSPGQKSSLGVYENGVNGGSFVLIPLDQRCQGPGEFRAVGRLWRQVLPSQKLFIMEISSIYKNRETGIVNPSASITS